MVNQDFSCFFESVFGVDRTVCNDFEGEFIVVGFLVYAEVFNGVLNVFDGGVDGVDGDSVDVIVGGDVFFGGDLATAFVDS